MRRRWPYEPATEKVLEDLLSSGTASIADVVEHLAGIAEKRGFPYTASEIEWLGEWMFRNPEIAR